MKASEFKKRLEDLIQTFGDRELVVQDADTSWYMDVKLAKFNPKNFKAFIIIPSGYGEELQDEEVEIATIKELKE